MNLTKWISRGYTYKKHNADLNEEIQSFDSDRKSSIHNFPQNPSRDNLAFPSTGKSHAPAPFLTIIAAHFIYPTLQKQSTKSHFQKAAHQNFYKQAPHYPNPRLRSIHSPLSAAPTSQANIHACPLTSTQNTALHSHRKHSARHKYRPHRQRPSAR